MITQRTKLDMRPGGVMPVVHVSQYDNDAAALIFDLYDDSTPFSIPSGYSVLLNGLKPDNYGFSYQASSYSGNTVVCNLTTQMTAVAGAVVCELRIRNGAGTQIVGTANFILQVEAAALTDDTIISDTMIPLIEQAVEIASNLDRYITQTQSNAETAAAAATTATNAANSAQIVDANVTGLYNSIEEAKTNANTAAANANAVAAQVAQQAASGAFKGDKGDKGDSGITAPVWGMYTMYVDESTGDLWLVTNGEYGSEYWFRYDSETGNLYYCTPEYVEKTVSGDLIEITDAANLGALQCKVAFSPIQSGSGDPSPSNIRPISGRTGLTVTRCGKNLGKITLNSIANADIGEGSYTSSGLTFSFTKVSDNGVSEIVANGTPTARVTSMLNRDLLVDMPPGRYILSGCPSGGALTKYRLTCWDNTTSATVANDFGSGATFELVEGHNVNFAIDISASMAGETISNLVFKPMIRPASDSNDAYEPYNGTSFPITWESSAGTVYGGTLDVVSGVLTVDMAIIDMGDASWSYSSNGYFFSTSIIGTVKPPQSQTEVTTAKCTIYAATISNNLINHVSDNAFAIVTAGNGATTGRIWIRDTAKGTDATAFKTAVTGQKIVYPLATPQTYQLTPTEVRTILGVNNLWSDGDTIEAFTYVSESYDEEG